MGAYYCPGILLCISRRFAFFPLRHLICTFSPPLKMFTIFQKSTCSYLWWMTHTSLRKYKQSGTNSSSRYQILQYTCLSFVSLYFTPVITEKVPLAISEFNFSAYTLGPLPFSLKDFNPAITFLCLLNYYFFSLHWVIPIFTHTCSHLWNSNGHISNFSWLHILLQLQTYFCFPSQ